MAVWMTHYEKKTSWYDYVGIKTWWYPDGYTCSECGTWRSNKANLCPHCGKPMENNEEE